MNKVVMSVAQIVCGIILVGLIIIQSKGGGLGSTFGGFGGVYRSKRGVERLVYFFTICVSIIFFLLAVTNFVFFS